MSERKDIERLFQEKFKDFEEMPSPAVWENIQSKLEKKEEKRRVVPFWLKASGIAAVMVLGFFTVDYFTGGITPNSGVESTGTVVSSEISSSKDTQNTIENNTSNADKNTSQIDVVVDSKSQDNESSLVYDQSKENENLKKNNKVTTESNQKITSNPSTSNLVSSEKMNDDKAQSWNKYQKSKRANSKKQFLPNPTNGVAAISPFKKEREEKINTSPAKENPISTVHNENHTEFVAQNNASEKSKSEENSNQDSTQNLKKEINQNLNISNQNNAIANGINSDATPSEKIVKDSVIVAVVAENPLDKILIEKEKQKTEEKIIADKTKWTVRPNVAPLFMNASQGSPIDKQFADNTKDFENNLSVGLGVDFALNSKLTIRTGINKFDLGYHTNDIEYYADLNAGRTSENSLQTINMSPQAKMIVIEDKNASKQELAGIQELAAQNTNEGYLNQKIGYIEVPFEVSYKLIDHKFGIKLISGLSTLFLNENEVSVVSQELTTVLGEANNLNKIHFSANVGVGFKYNFWKSFEANFEPTFKYQMNTFNSNSGGFKPYFIGLYTGLSFKF